MTKRKAAAAPVVVASEGEPEGVAGKPSPEPEALPVVDAWAAAKGGRRSVPLPRARPAVAAPVVSPPPPLDLHQAPSVFGAVPESVAFWGVCKRDAGGEWRTMRWAEPGAGVESAEWPLVDLSHDTLRDRWGTGNYEIQWIRTMPRGGRRLLRGGREVVVLPRPDSSSSSAPSSSAPSPADPFASLSHALQVLSVIETQADKKIDGYSRLAQAMSLGASRGISGEDLLRVMRDEREANAQATAAAIASALAPIHAALADDGEESPLADAAAAALPVFIKSKSPWAQALNLAFAHPDATQKIVGGVISAFGPALVKIAEALATKKPTAPAPVAAEVDRPRASPARVSRDTTTTATTDADDDAWSRLPRAGAFNGVRVPAADPPVPDPIPSIQVE